MRESGPAWRALTRCVRCARSRGWAPTLCPTARRSSSVLLENSTVEKVQELDSHVGVAISGLAADARNLVDHARVECANHKVRARRARGAGCEGGRRSVCSRRQ